MISVITGRLGSGKSYHAVELMIRHLLDGGVVATNMNLKIPEISRIWGRRFVPWQFLHVDAGMDPMKIPRGDFRGSGKRRVMVVLDEALNWFESSTARDSRRDSWGVWLRQSDKLGQDVYFVAQQFERAAKWIRELAQLELRVSGMRNFAIGPIPLGRLLGLSRLACVTKFDVQSGAISGWRAVWLNPSVWRCYSTAELYGFSASASAYVGDVPPRFRLPLRSALFVPLAVLVYQGVRYAFSS
jgi:hypothetical protein